MTGNLLVTPEKLIASASEFSSMASSVKALTDNMMSTINSLNATWAGEAHTAYATKFHALEDDMNKIFRMITEHSNDLQEMAQNYMTAESTNVDSGSSLPADVII